MRRQAENTVPAADPDDVTLSRHLTRARRRVRLILSARYLVVAMSLVVAAVAVAIVWPMMGAAAAWAALVAGVLAVASACLRTPDVREIAATVDGRLHRADATVTAAALRGNRDPIARLIVRDAIAGLTNERMASVFPFELGRPAIVAAAATVVCIVVAAGVTEWRATESTASGGMRIASREDQTSSRPRPPQTGQEQATQSDSITAAAQSAPATTRVETDATRRTDSSQRETDLAQSERPTGLATAPSGDDRPRGSRGDRPLPSQARPDLGRTSSSGSGTSGTAGSGGPSSASRPDAGQTGASLRAQTARTGPVGGVRLEDGSEGAGGVQQGRLRADTMRATVPSAANYRQSYRAARTHVDAAIARDEVPLSRRTYVRDYFLAIAPRD
jgi:hypothetical protein